MGGCVAVSLNKLTDGFMKSAGPGDYGDGGGLYLQVTETLSRSWLFRYKWHGKTNRIGLGATHAVSLKEARAKAAECRRMLADDINPRETRSTDIPTFGEAFAEYVKAQGPAWSNKKHAAQWHMTINTYAKKLLAIPVDQVDVGHIQTVLTPIWYTKGETARRLRQRIARVLGFAAVRKWRSRENPAEWKDNLDHILKDNKSREKKHHRAMPYNDLPTFMQELSGRVAPSARMMEFTIVTGSHTGEVINARWDQIDLKEATWTRPATVMKARVTHTVFLGPKAVELLTRQHAITGTRKNVFIGPRGGKMSNMAMLTLLDRMERRDDTTTHGFRSALVDWANEETNHERHVTEMALAHTIENKTEAAYRRGTLELKRRALMEDWETYLTTGVTPKRTAYDGGSR